MKVGPPKKNKVEIIQSQEIISRPETMSGKIRHRGKVSHTKKCDRQTDRRQTEGHSRLEKAPRLKKKLAFPYM